MFKKILTITSFLSVGALLTLHSTAHLASAAPAPTGTSTSEPAPAPSPNLCGSGWHVVAGTRTPQGGFTCQPNKASHMVKCPPGSVYFDDGCVVGCQSIPH